MKFALSITAALLLVICSVLPACAQEAAPAAPKPESVADRSVPPPTNPSFKATLVVLEADWSKAATAKQIEQDLQAALKDVPVPDNLRQSLVASGPQILFASEQAHLYRPEDLNDLLVWLERHKLVRTRIDYAIPDRMYPPPDDEPALSVDLDVLPVASPLPAPRPFVRERVQWRWSFQPVRLLGNVPGAPLMPGAVVPGQLPSSGPGLSETTIVVRRQLAVFEDYAGQQERSPQREDLEDSGFQLSFPRDRVAVVHVFADTQAEKWRTSTREKGVEAVLVVREASLSVPALEGRAEGSVSVRIPELVRRVTFKPWRGWSQTPSDRPPGGPPASTGTAHAVAETLKVFSLQHLDARTAASIVSQLFGRDSFAAAVEARGNALLARGDQAELAEVEALLLRLDSEPADRRAPRSSPAEPKRPADVELHAAQYCELEKQAAQTAAKLQQLRSKYTDSYPQIKELEDRLRRQVSAAFEARQQWQDAELVRLRARLAAIEESVAAREKIKDTIINRRVEELLDPDLRWEGGKPEPKAGKEAVHAEGPKGASAAKLPQPTSESRYRELVDRVAAAQEAKSPPPTNEDGYDEQVREFTPDTRHSQSVLVGVVTEVSGDGTVVISSSEVNGIRQDEELEVTRAETDDEGASRRFALVRVTSVARTSAAARVVAAHRFLDGDGKRFVFDRVKVGDRVMRPIR